MKRKLSLMAAVIMSLMLILPFTARAYNQPVIDKAGYLTDAEIADLCGQLNEIRTTYNIDVAVVIEDTMSGYNAESTADDIYDYNGYGLGEGKDGILLYISKNPRKYHYTTHGYGMTVFDDRGLEYIDNQVLPYLRNDEYYNAIYTYAKAAKALIVYETTGVDEYDAPYANEEDGTSKLIALAAVILAPFGISGLATGAKSKQMNTAVKQNYADSYMKRDSMNLTQSQDIFLYSVVNRTEKPKSDSGSSTHRSSSGEIHGGRGGSY